MPPLADGDAVPWENDFFRSLLGGRRAFDSSVRRTVSLRNRISPNPYLCEPHHMTRPAPVVQCNVMIAKDLLEILVCPACKQALEYRQNPESLKCKQCHRVYAVKDDIPIMLVDEATVEP